MKKFLLVGVVGLSALLGGCSSFVEFTMEEPRQAYPDQTPVAIPYYGDSDMAIKAGSNSGAPSARSGMGSRGPASSNLR